MVLPSVICSRWRIAFGDVGDVEELFMRKACVDFTSLGRIRFWSRFLYKCSREKGMQRILGTWMFFKVRLMLSEMFRGEGRYA